VIGFANSWAWIGAIALALPIAVHLLRRHRAARRSFPTLKFLPEARVVAVRRHRPTDVSLMVVRLLIVGAAIVALAQPIWRDRASASRSASTELARAVVVDRNLPQASQTVGGETATSQVVVETADIRAGLASAIGWVARQSGRREIVVVSGFPTGSVAASDVVAVPVGVGVRFVQAPTRVDERPIGPALARGASMRSLAPHLTLPPGETTVTWADAGAAASPAIEWRVKPEDASGLMIATGAALDVGVPSRASDRPVTIVLADALDRAQLVSGARPIDQPWMFDVIRALAADATLASAARSSQASRSHLPDALTPVVRDGGRLVLLAAGSVGSNPPQLLLTSNAPAASLFTAALAATVADATRATPWPTLEPDVIARDELTRWERPIVSSPSVVPPTAGTPLGRWLWIVALAWLAFESSWRRRMDALDEPHVVNRRVA
jgi:hypothetical protein